MNHGTIVNGSHHEYQKFMYTHMNGSLIAQARIKEEQDQKQEAAGIIHTSVIDVRAICMRIIHIHTYRVRDGACGRLQTHTNTRRLHCHTYPVALRQWSTAQDTED